MTSDDRDFADPTRADDVGGPDGTLGPTEATDPDELKNRDGDEVVDPPDYWFAAHKIARTAWWEHETLDDKLAAELPDMWGRRGVPPGAPDFPPPDTYRDVHRYRGQIDGTPEDGDSFFPVIEGPGYPPPNSTMRNGLTRRRRPFRQGR
jgi:hypothetical protein